MFLFQFQNYSGIFIAFFVCFINYIFAIKFFYVKIYNNLLIKKSKKVLIYVTLFFILRIILLLFISFIIVKYTNISLIAYFVSLFIFYFIFKILEVVSLNKNAKA